MDSRLGVWLVGAWIAVTTPAWLRGRRLRSLMGSTSPGSPGTPGATGSAQVALAMLRRLSWFPFSPWRDTCLYRSVAICRSLRACGIRARLRLGVRGPKRGEDDGIFAHAWVECDGMNFEDVPPEFVGPEPGYVGFRAHAKPLP